MQIAIGTLFDHHDNVGSGCKRFHVGHVTIRIKADVLHNASTQIIEEQVTIVFRRIR